VLALWH